MKRVLGALIIVAVLAYLPVSSLVLAQEPAGKILLCHWKGNSGGAVGRVINPNLHSSQVHIMIHGDLEFPAFTPVGDRANMCMEFSRIWICSSGHYRFPPEDDATKLAAQEGNCFVGIEDFPGVVWDGECSCGDGRPRG